MTTIQAKRLQEALQKARSVGRVEESFVIDECPVALQSLVSDDFEAIMADCSELEELAYLHAFQQGHVCRSIVEINGIDLRDAKFIEDEAPAGQWALSGFVPTKTQAEEAQAAVKALGGTLAIVPPDASEGTRVVKFERHEWVKEHILRGWSREAINSTWRKFTEVTEAAENRAKEGVEFRTPDETAEERYRRLLLEAKESEQELPYQLVIKILEEMGYLLASTPAELASAMGRVDQLAEEAGEAAKASQAPPEAFPPAEPQPPAPVPQAPPVAPQAPSETPLVPAPAQAPTPEQMMASRVPLNKGAAHTPRPPQAQPPAIQNAGPKAQVPDQLRQAALANSAQMGRSAQIAALEGAVVDPSMMTGTAPQAPQRLPGQEEGVPTLERPEPRPHPQGVESILDQPPSVGINPRFKKPPQL